MGRSTNKAQGIAGAAKDNSGSYEYEYDSNFVDTSNSGTHRIIYLTGEITTQIATSVTSKLLQFAQTSNRPIKLVLNTPGGYVDDALAIYDVMKHVRSPIHTVGIGKVMSAGVLLLAAGDKGNRHIGARARVMIHNGWSCFAGDPFEIENELEEFKRQEKMHDECFIAETKMTQKQLDEILRKRADYYITAEQIIKFGIADKITK